MTERMRAEAALRSSQQLLERTFASLRDAVFIVDADTARIVDCNPAASEIFGYSRQEMLGRTTTFLHVDEAALEEFRRHLTPAIERKGFLSQLEFRMKRKDGTVFPTEHSLVPLGDDRGQRLGWVSVVRDITERKQAEARLRLQAAALGAAASAIVITDREGRIAWANPAFTRLTGYTAEEAVGQTMRPLKSDQQDTAASQALWETILGGRVWRGELLSRRKDGSVYLEGQTITPVRDERGDISHFIAIKRDITEQKRAEEALATRTRQLEALRAVGAEITRELDLAVVLELITRRAAELLGATVGAIFLWDEATHQLVPQAWQGLGRWMSEVRLRLGEGIPGMVAERRQGMVVNDYRSWPKAHPLILEHTRITAGLAEPLLYRNQLVGVIIVHHEEAGRAFTPQDRETLTLLATQAAIAIENARLYETIRQHAAELELRVQERTRELEVANQQLQEASRHKSELLANMSHELRTPLNSIIGFSDLLQGEDLGPLTERQTRYLGHIQKSGQHLLRLINDILDLSKVEAGKIILRPEALPVAATLDDILVIARSLARKKEQAIETEIAPDLPPLWADPVRFKQILFNLLSNAVKFTPDRGRITLAARQVPAWTMGAGAGGGEERSGRSEQGPWLEVRVTDTGIGIRAADLPRLFQEFVQLEPPATLPSEGTGLGLALTKRLVGLHGGRIWAGSEGEGKGSTFTILLPCNGPPAHQSAPIGSDRSRGG